MSGDLPQKGKLMEFTYAVTPLSADTWRIDEAMGGAHTYAYLLEGAERALLIDTCQGLGNLRAAVEQLTKKPVLVANTHGHLDHIGGNAAFAAAYLTEADLPVAQEHGAPAYRRGMFLRFARELGVLLGEGQLDALAHRCEGARYLPMAQGDVFELGGRTLRVLATPGHTPGSVCFLEEGRGALYTGDTACARGVLLCLPHSCGVATFRQSIRSLRALADRFTTIHPGHHEAPLGPEVLEKYDACATGILEGRVQGIPGESAGEACLLGPWEDISIAYRADHIFD